MTDLYNIGSTDDPFAIGSGSLISQIKRLRRRSTVQYDLPPMWGASRLRNETSIQNNSGSAGITEKDGELQLSTGNDGTDFVQLFTSQYAQYRSGLYGEAAFGIRLGSLPSGDQVCRWGYFDDFSGFGWGVDATGPFTFFRENESDTIYRPPGDASSADNEWQLDPLDGTGESGLTIDLLDGHVFHTLFRLYGHGPVIQYVEAKDGSNHRAPEVAVDRRVYPTKINLVDFNRRLRVEVDNNGTSDDLELYLGGRQYSLWGDEGVFERRVVPCLVEGYTPTTSYEPILAVRKRANFPPGTSRGNSVSTGIVDIDAVADGTAQVRLTIDADVTNAAGDWSLPDGWTSDETALETISVDDTSPSVDAAQPGLTVQHAFLDGSKSASQSIEEETELPLGAAIEAVLWAKTDSNATVKASLTMKEQW